MHLYTELRTRFPLTFTFHAFERDALFMFVNSLVFLTALVVLGVLAEWFNGFRPGGPRVLDRFVWLMFEIAVSGCRAYVLMASRLRLTNRLQDFDAWCSSTRSLIMDTIRPEDFWPIEPGDKDTPFVSLRMADIDSDDVHSLPSRVSDLLMSQATLTHTLETRHRNLVILAQQMHRMNSNSNALELENATLERQVRDLTAKVKEQSAQADAACALARMRTHAARMLLVSMIIMWKHTRSLSRRHAVTQLKLLRADRDNDYIWEMYFEAAATARTLRSELSYQKDMQEDSKARIATLEHTIRRLRAAHARDVYSHRQEGARMRNNMAKLLNGLVTLWRLVYYLRLRLTEARKFEGTCDSLRTELRNLRDDYNMQSKAKSKIDALYKQSLTSRQQELESSRKLLQFTHASRLQLLTCVLVLWRFTTYLGRRLALAHVRVLACPVSCRPISMDIERYYAQFDIKKLPQASAWTGSSTLSQADSLDESLNVNLTDAQLLSSRCARVHSAYSVLITQLDEAWVALKAVRQCADSSQSGLRAACVALATTFKSHKALREQYVAQAMRLAHASGHLRRAEQATRAVDSNGKLVSAQRQLAYAEGQAVRVAEAERSDEDVVVYPSFKRPQSTAPPSRPSSPWSQGAHRSQCTAVNLLEELTRGSSGTAPLRPRTPLCNAEYMSGNPARLPGPSQDGDLSRDGLSPRLSVASQPAQEEAPRASTFTRAVERFKRITPASLLYTFGGGLAASQTPNPVDETRQRASTPRVLKNSHSRSSFAVPGFVSELPNEPIPFAPDSSYYSFPRSPILDTPGAFSPRAYLPHSQFETPADQDDDSNSGGYVSPSDMLPPDLFD
ncbi:hypothetical protein WOLCODRAFT_165256 [Wolfiporia cocos MD-104 SS10]|uniref:Uncharacterized protein n=1 Tax=Wolfiporia cocos (strain MD-104) TaxID=742152 RepID=A0A2H3K372_WOLCO|nr:hypothetical protein WOLCODRAFT_165256 [Wolfiporia cocos MD-104 SS10]